MIYGELINNFSAYPQYAGQTLNWLTADTKDRYNKNLKHHRDELDKNGWIDTSIEYSFNKYGFRSDEFIDDNAIMFLGCSHTVGIGLNREDTYADIVAKELNLKHYNLAIGGGSNDSAFRIGQYWIPKIKPKLVVLISPTLERFEILYNKSFIQLLPKCIPPNLTKFYNIWCSNNHNLECNKLKNQLALQFITEQAGCKFVCIEITDIIIPETTIDYARDLMHFGVESNKGSARILLEKIKPLI